MASVEEAWVLQAQWTTRAKLPLVHSLPDAQRLPAKAEVMPFCKSIHGALNPDTGSVAAARNALRPDTRVLFINATCLFAGSADGVRLACLDGACEFIDSESKFARALDQTDFGDWQQRNPDSPPFSVDLLGRDRKKPVLPRLCGGHRFSEKRGVATTTEVFKPAT